MLRHAAAAAAATLLALLMPKIIDAYAAATIADIADIYAFDALIAAPCRFTPAHCRYARFSAASPMSFRCCLLMQPDAMPLLPLRYDDDFLPQDAMRDYAFAAAARLPRHDAMLIAYAIAAAAATLPIRAATLPRYHC